MPRGGKRAGSGRKPDPSKLIRIPIRLEAPIREAIAKIKAENPRQ